MLCLCSPVSPALPGIAGDNAARSVRKNKNRFPPAWELAVPFLGSGHMHACAHIRPKGEDMLSTSLRVHGQQGVDGGILVATVSLEDRLDDLVLHVGEHVLDLLEVLLCHLWLWLRLLGHDLLGHDALLGWVGHGLTHNGLGVVHGHHHRRGVRGHVAHLGQTGHRLKHHIQYDMT